MLSIRMVRWPRRRGAARPLSCTRSAWGRRYIPFGSAVSIATKPYRAATACAAIPMRYARNAAAARDVGAGAVGDPSIAWLAGRLPGDGAPRRPARAGPDHGADPHRRGGRRPRLRHAHHGAFRRAACGPAHILVLPDARHEILSERDASARTSGPPSTPSCPAPTRPSRPTHAFGRRRNLRGQEEACASWTSGGPRCGRPVPRGLLSTQPRRRRSSMANPKAAIHPVAEDIRALG